MSRPRKLTFRLLSGPSGAEVNPLTGSFNWRPALSQAPSTNLLWISVTDNGSPSLAATQSFTIAVRAPATPLMRALQLQGDELGFSVAGDCGPTYWIYRSTNLVDWAPLYNTSPATLPFEVKVSAPPSNTSTFFRIAIH